MWARSPHTDCFACSACSYELGVLLVPSLEAAYRASRWVGFSCTSDAPMPAAGAARAAAGAAAGEGQAEGTEAAVAAAATTSSAAAQPPLPVRFVAWKRGDSQEAQAVAAGEEGGASSSSSSNSAGQELRVPLPIPYPLPPQRYQPGDEPWMVDRHWSGGCLLVWLQEGS